MAFNSTRAKPPAAKRYRRRPALAARIRCPKFVRSAICGLALLLVSCGDVSVERSAPTAGTGVFPIPQFIAVAVTPYASIDAALADEQNIDWLHDKQRARAITLAYAGKDLQIHLALSGVRATVIELGAAIPHSIVLASKEDLATIAPAALANLALDYSALGTQGYAIAPRNGSVFVTANERGGVLSGTYRLLSYLGFRWFDPYETQSPDPMALGRDISWRTIIEVPRVQLRGFWIFGANPIPDEFAIWLARNRFNIGGTAKPYLQHKLGLIGWGGGHDLLQQEFSRPGLYEQHPNWFGMKNGVRQPVVSSGTYFNIAFENSEAAKYFADRMIQRLDSGDLQNVDVLNIWPTDSRFNNFDQSPAALALGNESDNLLKFCGAVQGALSSAYVDGRLSRPVTIAGISYFLTMEPPTNRSITGALENSTYLHMFYLIDRDWSDYVDADLANRDSSRAIMRNLTAWQSFASLNYGIVEYHNQSNYAAIGLTDFPFLGGNYQKLTDQRFSMYAYMHPLLRNPGPRRLTNYLLANLGWRDPTVALGGLTQLQGSSEGAIDDYFDRRYGTYSSAWREVYEMMSNSVDNAKEIFGNDSLYWVLLQQYFWSHPPYTAAQAAGFVARYRVGGTQDLPGGYSQVPAIRESFRGLDESIQLQAAAESRWAGILQGVSDPEVRGRMSADIEWFTATTSRYRLMAATCDYVIAAQHGGDLTDARARIARETALLRESPVTLDTISPVDQRGFIALHKLLANIP